ncbi:hypothetical protein JD844_031911 [Phrynosoma platyrhinos]|uniref:Transposase Helix-turn-helix domain-containing protein n=1 Tax=Phrynosoma platyrhinos TaxID=52577 RepID=A0ABQ7T5A8_PHRPL|nr:hypothetical protein JD844_031911 [Phrynosoma platyrhinos]
MSCKVFNMLVEELQPHLRRQDTHLHWAIPEEQWVAIAIYILTHQSSYSTVATLFGVEKSTLCKAFIKVVIVMELVLMRKAVYPGDHRKVMAGFEVMGFPQVIGAVDGCYCHIITPVHLGARFRGRREDDPSSSSSSSQNEGEGKGEGLSQGQASSQHGATLSERMDRLEQSISACLPSPWVDAPPSGFWNNILE